MGNGYSQTELDETADWAYYIREEDDGEWLSKRKRRQVLTKSGAVDRSVGGSAGVDFSGKKANL